MMRQAVAHLKRLLLVQLAVTISVFCTSLTATTQTNERILLNVTVTTEKGAAVLDLTRENFSVNVDKRPQEILSFSSGEPASIGILIDTSGSLQRYGAKRVAQLKQNLKAGLDAFVQLAHPGNEYFVMTFNNDTELLQDWTSERESVTNKLESLEFKGQTALYDSIRKVVPKVTGGRHPRRVLIIVTDGHDSYSRSETKHVRETVKRSDVVLYALGAIDVSERNNMEFFKQPFEDLEEFAINSGGRGLFSTKFANSVAFTVALETIALELRSQYQLAISLEESVGKEKWRKLNVSVTRNDSSGRPEKLIVRTRPGYYR